MTGLGKAGEKMARRRKEKGLTQAALAQLLGITQRMVAAVESGERRPSVDLAKRIGQALEMPWTDFFEEEQEEEA